MADTTITTPSPKKEDPKAELKVAEIRDDGTVILEIQDGSGRMFPAEAKEGVQLRKGTVVEVSNDGEDSTGAPLNAKIVRAK